MNAAEIATGAPKPAAPSMKAPKEKAMMSACRRRSAEIAAIDSFLISQAQLAKAAAERGGPREAARPGQKAGGFGSRHRGSPGGGKECPGAAPESKRLRFHWP